MGEGVMLRTQSDSLSLIMWKVIAFMSCIVRVWYFRAQRHPMLIRCFRGLGGEMCL